MVRGELTFLYFLYENFEDFKTHSRVSARLICVHVEDD